MVTFTISIPKNFTSDEIETWLQRQGYTRIHKQSKKSIEVIQDRFRVNKKNRSRIAEAFETAFKHGRGRATLYMLDEKRQVGRGTNYSRDFICPGCDHQFRQPTQSLFSFNSPLGACDACRGFGRTMGCLLYTSPSPRDRG